MVESLLAIRVQTRAEQADCLASLPEEVEGLVVGHPHPRVMPPCELKSFFRIFMVYAVPSPN